MTRAIHFVRVAIAIAAVVVFVVVISLAMTACSSNAASATPPRNAAIDTVKYIEPGATCEAVIENATYQSARCMIPSSASVVKLYCAIGPDIKDEHGRMSGWACTQLAGPASASQPPSSQAVKP